MGLVARIDGRPVHSVVADGLTLLIGLEHRGATGVDEAAGDGAGILIQIPHRFFAEETQRHGFALPQQGTYGVGMAFLPLEQAARARCENEIARTVERSEMRILGWRSVPVDASELSPVSRAVMPKVRQFFVLPSDPATFDLAALERQLYLLRRRIERACAGLSEEALEACYLPSLSSRTVVYKGMVTARHLKQFYADLRDARLESAVALVHARYSTNTFPSWSLAHPYRLIAHNGEINTVRGNCNWMRAREASLRNSRFGDSLAELLPLLDTQASDSAILDQAAEYLLHEGRSVAHVLTMMSPEAWEHRASLAEDQRGFFQYHATLMEPWDGPALIAFCDGRFAGGILDRNGLRPARIVTTHDGLLYMASEVGALPLATERVQEKRNLRPGQIFMIDLEQQRLLYDDALKAQLAAQQPYANWAQQWMLPLAELPAQADAPPPETESLLRRQQAFGYTKEDLKYILEPMGQGAEAIGSMGNDLPLAVLSDHPRLLFDYFKQQFAQVTNPAIDPLREGLVMSLEMYVNPAGNLLDAAPIPQPVLVLPHPALRTEALLRLRGAKAPFQAALLSTLFSAEAGQEGLCAAVEALCETAAQNVREGRTLLILSDRGVCAEQAALPILLAVSGLHHHLVRLGLRSRVGLIADTGEAREVHHLALLCGYGATAVHPYLALETLVAHASSAEAAELSITKYIQACEKGLCKILSKMGISTLRSYHGGQIFECLGLNAELIQRYFSGTRSRIGGIGMTELCAETLRRHRSAFPVWKADQRNYLQVGGRYQFREDGEYHAINPRTTHHLQLAVHRQSQKDYDAFAKLAHESEERIGALRALLQFKTQPIPLDQVEPAEQLLRRFCTGAMSLGSISREVHEDIAIAMNQIGGKSNTGEGGEDPQRFHPDANGDNRNSFIKQVASGRFGVTAHYLSHAGELQIKIAQGAKPGEGGQLPGHKVDSYIGHIRHTTPGVGLISPPPHHDIYSIEDIKQLIFDLKNANPEALVSVKLVAETGVGAVAAGVAKGKADLVLISGHEGGTGASPQSSIQHAGIPWELGLAETQQTLVRNGLRGRIRVQTDGQLKTGRDVVIAALLGAEEFGFSTLPLISLGCVMMRVCHLNTCPVGIATQDPQLRANYRGKPEFVVRYFRFVAEETRRYLAELGFRTLDEAVGRVECLEVRRAVTHWKAKGLDLSPLLHPLQMPPGTPLRQVTPQQHGLEDVLDHTLIRLARPAIEQRQPVYAEIPICNANRSTGAMLSWRIARRYGAEGLPDHTVHFHFRGSAGQSFGAFLARGVSLTLEGDSNDYVGKGLSGGRLFVFPPREARFAAEDNILIGNVALYGATGGESFFNGLAGERFAVRNSGAHAVVEGVGDHGCEYMTGGRVIVLGKTGYNFAAGMSGGIAYVLNETGRFASHCNMDMVLLEALDAEDLAFVQRMVERHAQYTSSARAKRMLQDWDRSAAQLCKVIPVDYKRVLLEQKAPQEREIA